MPMDVTKSPVIPQNDVPNFGPKTDPTIADDRARETRNAVNTFQARYGERPKEARQIKKTLDKDDFMRIMISEMKNQDPTKPMDADKMASQMAQLTSVEQLKNMGSAIEKLADKNSASDRMAMSTMIGKSVQVDKGRFNHQKDTISAVNFDLPTDAAKIKLVILDERGEEVATRELEPQKAGPNVYNWDGMNASNIPSKSGSYTVRVDAEDAKGGHISVNPISRETIVGVTFEGGEANFLVGDPKNPQRVGMKSVTRIEADGQARANVANTRAQAAQDAQASQGANAAAAANAPFELPPALQEKFKTELAAREQPEAGAAAPEAPVKAEGFANGLSDQ